MFFKFIGKEYSGHLPIDSVLFLKFFKQFFKKILVSSTQQQILSTCFIFSDRFRLIIQTSSGCLNKIHKGTYFIPMLKSTGHVPIKV